MGARLDEHGLTPKKKMFADEYLKTGNLSRSYSTTHVIREGTKKATVDEQASRLVREPQVEAYIKAMQAARFKQSEIDIDYVMKGLIAVVENNVGKHASVRPLELLGKMDGHFWEKPAKKLNGSIDVSKNTQAVEQIAKMLENGLITEDSASAWIQIIEQKSKLEERENTNKEILEKLNTINSAMEKRDE